MDDFCKVVLLFGIIIRQIMELNAKDIRIGTVYGIDVIKDDIESQYPILKGNIGFMSLAESEREEKRPKDSAWRCGDDQSYYFEPLNECYFISVAQFLNVDSDRKIAYGGTRDEYVFSCWQQYRGKLLDIGLERIGEKMSFVKEMIINFNHRSFNRQAIQVGFMINRDYELISQNGEHYDVLDKVQVKDPNQNDGTFCSSVCCIVFFADIRITNDVKMIYTSCDNRTRALSYICQAPALA
ncbi:unnamed protein product [Onchocerca flexuosa]|uniref:Pep_M12B_propep domain-containing protein n=1 Tax=Onchocerca flexuosa TaxID=387005 RepID=A0A183HZ19_9BILA|nr:unnamed protein product [Onchocerca flexuosa]